MYSVVFPVIYIGTIFGFGYVKPLFVFVVKQEYKLVEHNNPKIVPENDPMLSFLITIVFLQVKTNSYLGAHRIILMFISKR